jgi:cytochrome P450
VWWAGQVRMYLSSYAAFRNPAFFDRPDTFVLERFLGSDGEGGGDADKEGAAGLARLLNPFGGGQRVCVGQRYVATRSGRTHVCQCVCMYVYLCGCVVK